jgi:hypothetical protein
MQTAVLETPDQLKAILNEARTIAVVGCSCHPHRTSYAIFQYLKAAGYDVIPVNPNHEACDDVSCQPDLLAIPDDTRIDIVNIFRNPRHTAEMVDIAVQRAENTGHRPVIWTQLGVSSPEAEETALRNDLPYVKNRCIMVEHRRHAG